MAIKNTNLNLGQLNTLGGGNRWASGLTDEDKEWKLKIEEKRRAQIRALDELEAEAKAKNLAANKNAPVAQNSASSTVFSSVMKNGLGISDKVVNQSVKSRVMEDRIKRAANEKVGSAVRGLAKRVGAELVAGAAEIGDLGVTAVKSFKGGLDYTKATGGGTKGMPTLGVPFEKHDTRTLGEKIVQNDSDAVLKDIKKDASTFVSGAEDYKRQYLTSGETLSDTAAKEVEKVNEEYDYIFGSGFGKVVGDTIGNTARQVPRLLISAIPGVGKALSIATMYGTSSMSGYKEAIQNGADEDTARMYAVLSGAIEAVGEELIGGVLGQGVGALDKYVFKIADKISSPIFKTAAKLGLSTLGEGAEEMIQSVLSTIAQKATYDPDAEIDFAEVAYEGLIGALSAGLMTAANPMGVRNTYIESSNEVALNKAKKGMNLRTTDEILEMIDGVYETAVELGQEQQFRDALLSVYENNFNLENKKTVKEKLSGLLPSKSDADIDAQMYENFTDFLTSDISDNAKKAVAEAAAKYDVGTAETRESGGFFNVSESEIAESERLSKTAGKKVVFFDEPATEYGTINGYYENGVIYVNKNAKNPLAVVFAHELTHSLEGTDAYDTLSGMVFRNLRAQGADIGALRDNRLALDAKFGVESDLDSVDFEIVADYVSENFMGNEAKIRSIVTEDRSLAVKIREFFDRVLAKFGNEGAKTRVEEYNQIKEVRDLYRKALGETVESGDRKNSFAGVNSKTADMAMFERAQNMDDIGIDRETIFAETGWLRGADGQWRYEIDDSGMKYNMNGDAKWDGSADDLRMGELFSKVESGESMTADEAEEFSDLWKKYTQHKFSLSENNSENEVRDEDVFYERGISDEDTAAELDREEAAKNASDVIRGEIVESKGKLTKAEAAEEKRLQKMKEKADRAGRNPLENMTEKDMEVLELVNADQNAALEENNRQFYERAKEFADQRAPLTEETMTVDEAKAKRKQAQEEKMTAYAEHEERDVRDSYTEEDLESYNADRAKADKKIIDTADAEYMRQVREANERAKMAGDDVSTAVKYTPKVEVEVIRRKAAHITQEEYDAMPSKTRGALNGTRGRIANGILYAADRLGYEVYIDDGSKFVEENLGYEVEKNSSNFIPEVKAKADAIVEKLIESYALNGTIHKADIEDSLYELLASLNVESKETTVGTDNSVAMIGSDIYDMFKRYGETLNNSINSIREQADNFSYEDTRENAPVITEEVYDARDQKVSDDIKGIRGKIASAIRNELHKVGIELTFGEDVHSAKEKTTDLAEKIVKGYVTGTLTEESLKNDFEAFLDEYGNGEITDKQKNQMQGKLREIISRYSEDLSRHATIVKQYAESEEYKQKKNAEAKKGEDFNLTAEQIKDLKTKWNSYQKEKRKLTKLEESAVLTSAEREVYEKLKTGEMSIDGVSESVKKRVGEMYSKYRELQDFQKEVRNYRNEYKQWQFDKASTALGNIGEWKDDHAFSEHIRTMERNIKKAAPNSETAKHIIENYINPIYQANALATKYKNDIRKRVEALGLETKAKNGNTSSESAAVQFIGEARDAIRRIDEIRGLRDKVNDRRSDVKKTSDVTAEISEDAKIAEAVDLDGGVAASENGVTASENGVAEAGTATESKISKIETANEPTIGGATAAEWKSAISEFKAANPNMNWEKIDSAIEEMHKIYDEIFEKMNEAYIKAGYEPIEYRRGYFPHFQENARTTTIKIGNFSATIPLPGMDLFLSPSDYVADLPTNINGQTHLRRPGVKFNPNKLSRGSGNTVASVYDAVKGIDMYIETAANVIYLTDSIQNLRALEDAIKYKTGDEAVKKESREIREDGTISEEERRNKLDELATNGKYRLSSFLANLTDYTNKIAGKQSMEDRGVEYLFGREALNLANAMKSKYGGAVVGVNVSSALTNFIPIVQATANTPYSDLMRGLVDAVKSQDGFADKSVFLTTRRGSDSLLTSNFEKGANALFGLVDNIASETIVRAKYYQLTKQGMSESDARTAADSYARGLMAGRSVGEMPTTFNSKNPLTGAFKQFQLEVSNQFQWMTMDVPEERKEAGKSVAMAYLRMFIGSWIYNEINEAITGNRPALDPIDMLNDTAGDLTGYKIPNTISVLSDLINGREIDFETEKANNFFDFLEKTSLRVAAEVPFVGTQLSGGRIPVMSIYDSIGDVLDMLDVLATDDISGKYKAQTVANTIFNVGQYAFTGGSQVRKIIQGFGTFLEGGRYEYDKDGERHLVYPVDQNVGTALQGVLFGRNSFRGAQEWADNGYSSLSVNATNAYEELVDFEHDKLDAYDLVSDIGGTKKTDEMSASQAKLEAIDSNEDLSVGEKGALYYYFVASDTERENIDLLIDSGVSDESIYYALSDFKEISATGYGQDKTSAEKYEDLMEYVSDAGINMNVIEKKEGEEYTTSEVKRVYLNESKISDEEKAYIYRYMLAGEHEESVFDECVERGDDVGDIYNYLFNTYISGSQAEKLNALSESKISDESKYDIYYFDYALDSELEALDALKDTAPLGELVETLVDIRGAKKSTEKRSLLYSSSLTAHEQSTYYFMALASSSQKSKLADLIDGGLSEIEYYDFLINTLDVEGEDRKEQIMEYIDGTGLSSDEKDLLYVAAGYSEKTLSKAPWHSGGLFGDDLFGDDLFGDDLFGDDLFSGGLFGD